MPTNKRTMQYEDEWYMRSENKQFVKWTRRVKAMWIPVTDGSLVRILEQEFKNRGYADIL